MPLGYAKLNLTRVHGISKNSAMVEIKVILVFYGHKAGVHNSA